MERVIAFIDGFNMYHSLIEARLNNRKWLDYAALAKAFTRVSDQDLTEVYYFSALVPWDQAKAARHKVYIKALQFSGVNVVLGKYKRVTRNCRGSCREKYATFEEKETDVNIAVFMLKLAMLDSYDAALLFSGDSDLVPAVKAVKAVAPHKHIKVVVPFDRSAVDLKNICDSSAKIKRHHLDRHQFPDPIVVNAAKGVTIPRPVEWA